MEKIGVEAVVEGLSAFASDMGQVQSSIDKIVPSTSILQDAFSALGNAAGDFASWVGDVLTYTLGGLLKDAIEGVISAIQEMVSATIEAGSEFQTLMLRLNGINLDTLTKSGMDYNNAMTEAVKLTKDQLDWLQLLAIQTPYDNKDIANVYTMARTYGFADEQARALTEDVANLTAGMGLEKASMIEIIRNLGQMAHKGKITGREMTDLANRQVPIADILDRVAKKMGVSVATLSKMISKPGGGVDYKLFITAFQEMTDEEDRFIGASERMARTFKAASDNVMDLLTSFGGLNVVAPVLDVLGGKIADFMDQFSTNEGGVRQFTELGERLRKAFISVGDSIAKVVSAILGLAPSSKDLATGLVDGLEWIAQWLTDNKDSIVGRVVEIIDWVKKLFAPPIENATNKSLMSTLQELYDFFFKVDPKEKLSDWELLKFAISEVGKAIGDVLLAALKQLGITDMPQVSLSLRDLVKALLEFSDWIKANQDLISSLLILIGAFIILQTIANLAWGFIAALAGIAVTVVLTIAALATLPVAITYIVAAVIGLISNLVLFQAAVKFMTDVVIGYFKNMKDTAIMIFNGVAQGIRNLNWMEVGWAIISGIAYGIYSNANLIVSAAQRAALDAFNAAKTILGIHSPSTLFSGIGENMMAGMAQGIINSAGLVTQAMQEAIAATTLPAMNAPAITQQYSQAAPRTISSTYQTNNQYNLHINSSANTEPIVQDFNMMQSLAGA